MTRWFALQPVDAAFFTEAPHLHTLTMELPAAADDVWAGLTVQRPLRWIPSLAVRYTSPAPYGVGTLREVEVLGGVLRLKEHFFAWDDGQRHHSFYVTHANLPGLAAFAEDYRVVPTQTGCRFTWTFAVAGRKGLGPALGPGHRLVRRLLYDRFGRDTVAHWSRASR